MLYIFVSSRIIKFGISMEKKRQFWWRTFFLDIRLNETTTFLAEKKKRSQLVYTRGYVHIQSGSFRTFLINQMSMFTHWKRRFLTHSFSVIFRTFFFIGALRFWLHKYLKLDNNKKKNNSNQAHIGQV